MRIKTTVAIVTIALLGVIAFSVIGQEEPLPVVVAKTNADIPTIQLAEPTIALATEPIREYRPPTLIDAARHNDYITFDALYAAAKKRGDDVAQFDALHELWTYAVTDPIGAFYGIELYQRLSRAYPGYAAYIDGFQVVDSRGNVFYPTSETRSFLLDRAVEGRPMPRVQVADTQPIVPRPKPEPVAKRATPPIEKPAVVPVAVAVTEPVAVPEPVAIAPAPAPVAAAVAEPVVIAAKDTAPAPAAAPAPAPIANPNPTASRGILLMIIGLIGVGLLALILRTPREEPMTVIHQPPVNNVEPLRKPQTTVADDSRATGSHG